VSNFRDFSGFVRLDKCKLDIFKTYIRNLTLISRFHLTVKYHSLTVVKDVSLSFISESFERRFWEWYSTLTCTRVVQNTHIVRKRTGKTNERTTVVNTNSLTSRLLLTQKKRFRAEEKKFLAIEWSKTDFLKRPFRALTIN
jgi:hypothetical protein